jgi:hypothetical protein
MLFTCREDAEAFQACVEPIVWATFGHFTGQITNNFHDEYVIEAAETFPPVNVYAWEKSASFWDLFLAQYPVGSQCLKLFQWYYPT